jgi:hypothetical protein
MADAAYHRVEAPDDYVVLDKPGAIRWATGDPQGARSQTWQVVGAQNSDDVYVGARGVMNTIKLSLHKSGIWRVALTQPAAAKYLSPGEDALLERYLEDESYLLAPGWRCAVRILTPAMTFRTGFVEKATRDGQPIRFYRRPDPPHELEYHVLLGDASAQIPTFTNAFKVGQMILKSGKRIWVVGTLRVLEDQPRMALQAMREQAVKDQLPDKHLASIH